MMEIALGIWAAIYWFVIYPFAIFILWPIKLVVQFWPILLIYILVPGLLLGALMQRFNFSYLSAFFVAMGLLLLVDTLFNPSQIFLGRLLNTKNLTVGAVIRFAVAAVVCSLPFFLAIRLGYILGRRFQPSQASS